MTLFTCHNVSLIHVLSHIIDIAERMTPCEQLAMRPLTSPDLLAAARGLELLAHVYRNIEHCRSVVIEAVSTTDNTVQAQLLHISAALSNLARE
jgi:hypothetical protein